MPSLEPAVVEKASYYGPAMGKYLVDLALATSEMELWTSLTPDRYLDSS